MQRRHTRGLPDLVIARAVALVLAPGLVSDPVGDLRAVAHGSRLALEIGVRRLATGADDRAAGHIAVAARGLLEAALATMAPASGWAA